MAKGVAAAGVVALFFFATSSASAQTSVTLDWSAPGDNNGQGQAAVYDIRFATVPLSEANWASATQATGEPLPKPVGQAETFTVNGLQYGTTYFVGIKASDEVPNTSSLSNVVQVTTPVNTSNLLQNADFESATFMPPWEQQNNPGTSQFSRVPDPHDGAYAAKVVVMHPGQYYETQLFQRLQVEQGAWYHVEFWAKSSVANRQIVVAVTDAQSADFRGLWYQPVLTTAWQPFSVDFQATASGEVRFAYHVGNWAGFFTFDTAVFRRIDTDSCDPVPSELFVNGDFNCSPSPYGWVPLEDHLGGGTLVTTTASYEGSYAVVVDPGTAGLYYQTQVTQMVGPIVAGRRYHLHCVMKSAVAGRQIVVGLINPLTQASLGLWKEPILGTSWSVIDTTFTANASVSSAKFSFYVGAWSNPFTFDDASLTLLENLTATGIERGDALEKIVLMPNPASQSVTFAWSSTERVCVEVFDVSGRQVWGRDSACLPAPFTWDLRSSRGEDLASGPYFVRLTYDGREEMRRLIIVR